MDGSFDDDQESQNKKKRRPRSSAGERNYFCGCGKAYLSYPALYTHVKNKHEGIFPIGSNAKRKIPRHVDDESDNIFTKDIKTFYVDLKDYLSQIEEARSKEEQQLTKVKVEEVLKEFLFLSEERKDQDQKFSTYLVEMLIYKDKLDNFKENQE